MDRHLEIAEQRVSPVRGLVPLQNRRGERYPERTLRQWIRANRLLFKTPKIDLLMRGDAFHHVPALQEFAARLGAQLSLRVDCTVPPPDLGGFVEAGLLDVYLCPASWEAAHFDAWLTACTRADVPCRVQLPISFATNTPADAVVARLADSTTRVVNVALLDPFAELTGCRDLEHSRAALDAGTRAAAGLQALGIESNLLRWPFCLAPQEFWPNVVGERQFFLDHQQYRRPAYDLALKLYDRKAVNASKALLVLLGKQTSYWNPMVDRWLYPLLLRNPWWNIKLWLAHKLTRHLAVRRHTPHPMNNSPAAWEHAIDRAHDEALAAMPAACAACSLRRICDRQREGLTRAVPGVEVQTVPGELVVSPMHHAADQPKYYDAVDAARRDSPARLQRLANEATDIIENRPPTREIDSFQYEIVGQWSHQMPGGLRWYSLTNTEKLSTPLTRIEPPCTISVTFGGGFADYIGFAFGRHGRIVCDMDAFSHRLVLHVDAEGCYVLLRDGVPVRPIEFEDTYFVPQRLGGVLEPALSITNIDGAIMTQTIFVWEDAARREALERAVQYSFLIVSTRYARRLQAVLQSIAHQEGIRPDAVEVIIAYVPGIDAVDDVIESCSHAFPGLRIVRSPFAEQMARAKGYMINESVKLASGEWVVLLDSDTLLPPRMMAAMDAVPETVQFVASDGRKMLDEETTAKILLGEIRPWECFDALIEGAGEFRLREAQGVPIGFFQAVRRACFENVNYIELDHFEGSDWQFGAGMRREFGREHRLSGMPVLHLDHGGSQWYGTTTHR